MKFQQAFDNCFSTKLFFDQVNLPHKFDEQVSKLPSNFQQTGKEFRIKNIYFLNKNVFNLQKNLKQIVFKTYYFEFGKINKLRKIVKGKKER